MSVSTIHILRAYRDLQLDYVYLCISISDHATNQARCICYALLALITK